MTPSKVLLVEDDRSLVDVLQYNLKQQGYQLAVARDGDDALRQIRSSRPDLVILDLMLPLVSGVDVCRQLRSQPETADIRILMLTAKSEESDQLVGFAVGADDYVTKPFSVKVLLERVKVLLRRRDASPDEADMVSRQGIEVDRMRFSVKTGQRPVELTKTEFRLLDILIRNPGRAFTRPELLDYVIGDDSLVLERTIDVHVRALRQKLGDYAVLIDTVRGIGYRFRDE